MTRNLFTVPVLGALLLTVPADATTELANTAFRRPGTQWVDISYGWPPDRNPSAAGDSAWIAVEASWDGGSNWDVPVISVVGDVGHVAAGPGRILWYIGAEVPLSRADDLTIRVLLSDTPSIPDGLRMIRIPPGDFAMGTDRGDRQEGPSHTVTLDAYWIDRYETTNRAFQRFVQDTGLETLAEKEGRSVIYRDGGYHTIEGASWWRPSGPGSSLTGRLDHPVVQVSWDEADAYCLWAGKRPAHRQ